MKRWTAKSIAKGSKAPGKVTRIASALTAAFHERWEGESTLLRIGRHHDDGDYARWEIEVELAPGLVLPVEYGMVETMHEEWDDPRFDEDGVVANTLEAVDACLRMVDHLSDAVHAARIKARAGVAAWAADGTASRVVDVRLAPYDHWRGRTTPEFRVSIDSLDENLQPTVETLDTWDKRDLDALLDEVHDQLRRRRLAANRLARLGAAGEISQIALNAIAEFGDVATTLRRFRREWRFWLPDDTAIVMTDGKVRAGNGSTEVDVACLWDEGGLSVAEHLVVRDDPISAIGQPARRLVDHSFLSDDILVEGVAWKADDLGRRWLDIRLTVPRRLFCSVSGRVWDAETPKGGEVVPFRRRA